MMQLVKYLFLGVLIVPSLLFSSHGLLGGKKIYKAFSNTIKSSANIVRTTMNMEVEGTQVEAPKVQKINPQKREAFLKEQFTPQNQLQEIKVMHTQEINIESEAIEFFDSLNASVKKPINIE
ncbi:MAG: hypothetical protein Q9M43_11890 [Sulfurimonas sp.]|nr:hypothetical protein [Sulfurimonas sp.]